MKQEDYLLISKMIKDRCHRNQLVNALCICGNTGKSISPYICKAIYEMFEAYKRVRIQDGKEIFDK